MIRVAALLLSLFLTPRIEYENPAAAEETECVQRCFGSIDLCQDECGVVDPVNAEERGCLDKCVEEMMDCVHVCWRKRDEQERERREAARCRG